MSITRKHTNTRMSQIVIHNSTVYLAGQVGTRGESVADQTREILGKIDARLEEAGSDKSQVLQAVIWMRDMKDFNLMNEVWDAWVPEGQAPARACGQSDLAAPDFEVEITVIAAQK